MPLEYIPLAERDVRPRLQLYMLNRHTSKAIFPLKGWLLFLLSCVGIGFFWLVVLPAIAQWAPVRNHLQRMDQADINVGAMFYTELNWEPPTGPVWR